MAPPVWTTFWQLAFAASCWQYGADLVAHHFVTERVRQVHDYTDKQKEWSPVKRAILVDWLVHLHHHFELEPPTLHVTVYLMDRHLEQAKEQVSEDDLYLVALAALMVASKYDDRHDHLLPVELEHVTDGACTKEELISMETQMLATVGYHATFPTACSFADYFVKVAHTMDDRGEEANAFVAQFAHWLVVKSLADYAVTTKYLPSQIAASAVYLARARVGHFPCWNPSLAMHSTYSCDQLWGCIQDLLQVFLTAVREEKAEAEAEAAAVAAAAAEQASEAAKQKRTLLQKISFGSFGRLCSRALDRLHAASCCVNMNLVQEEEVDEQPYQP